MVLDNNSIVFITPYSYLALPYYYAILPFIKKYQTIYLHLRDPYISSESINVLKLKKDILNHFDSFYDFPSKEYESLRDSTKLTRISQFLTLFKTAQTVKKYKTIIENFLDDKNPKAVISSSDLAINDKITSIWCKKNNVPFFIIQPAFLEGVVAKSSRLKVTFPRLMFYYLFNKFLGAPIFLRRNIYGNEAPWGKLLLWGDYFKLDSQRENTFIVGNPVFDRFFKEFSPDRSRKNQIVFCTQEIDKIFGKNLFDKVNNIILHAIKELPELTFYIKVHPRENITKYENIFVQHDYPNLRVVKDYDLHQLFKESDLQISVMSFTSVEAAAIGIPVITIAFPEFYKSNIDHFRGEIDIRVTDIQEITDAISYALSSEYWEQFLQKRKNYFTKMMHSMDGNSSERAANTILSLISNN